jgi:hypothetical protein
MPEIGNVVFSYKEVVTALLKANNIHEGIWALIVKFGLQATNLGEGEDSIRPAAIIPVLEIGIQKVEKETNISVDAAKVNPMPAAKAPV